MKMTPTTFMNDLMHDLALAAPEEMSRSAKRHRMCHNVHMKEVSIRDLHLNTGRWVRHAAGGDGIVVTDRGRRVAVLQPFDPAMVGRPLPNREARIRRRSRVPIDSSVALDEVRGR